MGKEINLDACEGRHPTPANGAYFFSEDTITEITQGLRNNAEVFESYAHRRASALRRDGVSHVNLYVTGMGVAQFSAAKMLNKVGISVTLMHYDPATRGYYSQHPFVEEKAARRGEIPKALPIARKDD